MERTVRQKYENIRNAGSHMNMVFWQEGSLATVYGTWGNQAARTLMPASFRHFNCNCKWNENDHRQI